MKYKKIRIYINAEFMDLLDFTAQFFNVRASHILRFSLKQRSKNANFKKPQRKKSVSYRQQCLQKSKKASKTTGATTGVLPYFANDEYFAKRGDAEFICVA